MNRNQITGMDANELAEFIDFEWNSADQEQTIAVIVALARNLKDTQRTIAEQQKLIEADRKTIATHERNLRELFKDRI